MHCLNVQKSAKTFLFIHATLLLLGSCRRRGLATNRLARLTRCFLRLDLNVTLPRLIRQLHHRLTRSWLNDGICHGRLIVRCLSEQESPSDQANQQTTDSPCPLFHVLLPDFPKILVVPLNQLYTQTPTKLFENFDVPPVRGDDQSVEPQNQQVRDRRNDEQQRVR